MALTLTKISETQTKITLGWTPVPSAVGYRFQSSASAPKWSHTWDPNRSQVTFSKAEWYKVEALGVEQAGQYPPLGPTPTGKLYGVHSDMIYAVPDTVRIAALANLEVTLRSEISRGTMRWDQIEPSQGNFNWSGPDMVDAAFTSRGIERMYYMMHAPGWVNNNGGGFYWPSPGATWNNFVARYANVCGLAAQRYTGVHWEIWNEVNEGFVTPLQANATQYIQLYTAARNAILSADPTAKVAAGSVTGLSGTYALVNGIEFLRQMVVSGVEIDHVGIHPYDYGEGAAYAPDVDQAGVLNFTDIARCKATLDGAGYKGDYWASEFGWTDSKASQATIAGYVTKYLNMLKNQYPYVSIACWFINTDGWPSFEGYGLANTNFSLKPQGVAFRDWMAANH